MKKLAPVFMIIMLFCTACSEYEKPSFEIKEDIVLVEMYTNYASGYVCNGRFFDKYGNAYLFDLSEKDKFQSLDAMLSEMYKILKTNKSTEKIFSKSEMIYAYSLLQKVDENADFESYGIGCDMGQHTLYGVRTGKDGKQHLITIYSYGNMVNVPTDKSANKLLDFCRKAMNFEIN